jgi:hypothetical protein
MSDKGKTLKEVREENPDLAAMLDHLDEVAGEFVTVDDEGEIIESDDSEVDEDPKPAA